LEDKEAAFEILQNISGDINNRDWLSTQTASWSLISAAKFSGKYFKGESETKFELSSNGEKTQTRTQIPVVQIPVQPDSNEKVKVEYENQGENASFARVLVKGIPTGVDSTSSSNNILLQVKYLDSANNPLNPRSIKQGTDFRLEVTVKHPGKKVNYEEMVLSTLFPSGWEIINKRVGGVPQGNTNYEYQDIRDDRVYTYFDIKQGEKKTLLQPYADAWIRQVQS